MKTRDREAFTRGAEGWPPELDGELQRPLKTDAEILTVAAGGWSPELDRELQRLPRPVIRPQGIRWRLVGDALDVELDLENPTASPTRPGRLTVAVAAFGAFLPSRAAAQVPAPGLLPRTTRTVRVPIELTEDEREHGMTTLDWAGNLDIWFNRDHAVEVHRALDIQVRAHGGALFVVFPHRVRTYAARCSEVGDGWGLSLGPFAGWSRDGLRGARHDATRDLVLEGPCGLRIFAPEPGSRAEATVAFTRATDGRTVPVEFSFISTTDPIATCRRRPPTDPRTGVRVTQEG